MVLGFEGAGEAFLGASDTLDALLVRPSRARSLLNIIIPLPEVSQKYIWDYFLKDLRLRDVCLTRGVLIAGNLQFFNKRRIRRFVRTT